MRLSPEQIQQIHQVIQELWKQVPFRLYLYGSRVHDHLKGGDIDLLILTDKEGLNVFREHELELLVKIKKQPQVGQRRIDIKAATEEDMKTIPFLRDIAAQMVKLNK